jgi:membrane-associated phospholipid phosphatase
VTTAYLVFVVGVIVTAAVVGAIAFTRPWERPGVRRRSAGLVAGYADLRADLGQHLSALVVLLTTASAAVIITWPVARFARRFQPQVDDRFYHWTVHHLHHHGTWWNVNNALTKMGNRPFDKPALLVAGVVFAVIWAVQRRGWWKPLLVVSATYVFEKYGQFILKSVADRDPANAGAGSFPSGGCARMVTTFGIIFFLVLLTWPRIGQRWRALGWTVIGTLLFVEGYTRLFLLKHWLMDVVGGWLFGTLLLLGLMAAATCLTALGPRRSTEAVPRVDERAPAAAGQPER